MHIAGGGSIWQVDPCRRGPPAATLELDVDRGPEGPGLGISEDGTSYAPDGWGGDALMMVFRDGRCWWHVWLSGASSPRSWRGSSSAGPVGACRPSPGSRSPRATPGPWRTWRAACPPQGHMGRADAYSRPASWRSGNAARLVCEVRVPGQDPSAMVPGANGVFGEPVPHGGFRDHGHQPAVYR